MHCYVPLECRPDVGKVHTVGDALHRGLKATAGTWAIPRISGLLSKTLKHANASREGRQECGLVTKRTKLEKLGLMHYYILNTNTQGL